MNNINKEILGIKLLEKTLLTEKSVRLESYNSTITFFTRKSFTKNDVKEGLFALFGEKPISIRVISTKSKKKAFQGRSFYTSTKKKFMVRFSSLKKIQEVLNVAM